MILKLKDQYTAERQEIIDKLNTILGIDDVNKNVEIINFIINFFCEINKNEYLHSTSFRVQSLRVKSLQVQSRNDFGPKTISSL